MEVTSPEVTILDAAAATGAGTAINVKEFDYVTLMVSTVALSSLTAKVVGSAQQDEPDWATAAGADNHWDYVDVTDLEDEASIDGDTGLAVADAAEVRTLRVNVQGLTWLNANVTAYTDGSITVRAVAFDND
tara:strand:- start:118 stop:513 length:396 start_codon:yes stop_codon:yes gene_type:complete